jgi:hypothetical protein
MSDLDNTLLETSQPNISITNTTAIRADPEFKDLSPTNPGWENRDIMNIKEDQKP